MLVKELRQGLRAKTFVIVFLVLQGLLGLILLAASAGSTSARAGEKVSEIVFVFFSLTVLVIQPLRGIGVLSGEIRGQTIDLMVLTRLSAMRIVLGKWVAIVSQSALIAATIFPYLILRYYFGGMSLFAELLMVLMILLLSAGFTAITVGISACSSMLVRGILPILASLPLVMVIFKFGFSGELVRLIEVFTFADVEVTCALLVFLLAVAHIGACMLSMGASLIAPHAENHATPRRLAALAVLVAVPLLLRAAKVDEDVAPYLWFVFAALPVTMALTEPISLVPSIVQKFTARGAAGKLAGRFLYPGWPSGVFYSFVVIGLGVAAVPVMIKNPDTEEWATLFGLIGSLLLPGLVVVMFDKKIKDRFAVFLLTWAMSFGLSMVMAAIADEMASKGVLWAFTWSPLITLPMVHDSHFDKEPVMTIAMVFCALYGAILLVRSLATQKVIREVESQSLSE